MQCDKKMNLNKSVVYQIFLRSFTLDGTLRAAETMLPHIASLGVDIVYLCPVVEADDDERVEFWSKRQRASELNNPKNPYRLKDYYKIDPEYGTDDDLRSFVRAAHKCGLRVLLDLVYYHCGPTANFIETNPDFVRRDEDGKVIDGNWHFPEINFDSPALREHLWQNMEYFIREFDVDGYRCDVSFSVPTDFWEEGRRRIEALKPGILMIAESESDPETEQRFAFDVNYSFSFCHALDDILKNAKTVEDFWSGWDERSYNTAPGITLLRSFDNHDIANDNYDNRPDKGGANSRTDAALAIAFTMNGVPFLYNGQEVADGRRHSIFGNRFHGKNMVVDWARGLSLAGQGRMKLVKELIQLRRNHEALIAGEVIKVKNTAPANVLSFLRKAPGETIFVAANLGNEVVTVDFDDVKNEKTATLRPGEWFAKVIG